MTRREKNAFIARNLNAIHSNGALIPFHLKNILAYVE